MVTTGPRHPVTSPSQPSPEAPPPASSADVPATIGRRYLMVNGIPYYVDDDGRVWLDRLWHRDFVRHMTYLTRLTFAAPAYRRAEAGETDLVRVDVPDGVELRFVAIPKQESKLGALRNLPRTARVLWKEVAASEIVHSGIAGWPFPVGWLANAAAMLQRKSLVIVVESAPWRLTGETDNRWKRRLGAVVTETLGRWFVNHAAVSFFTQPNYRETLLTHGAGPGYVTPATWIDENDILDLQGAERVWKAKRESSGNVRLLFAGRLAQEKGVEILLDAVELLRARGLQVDIDIIGEGPLRSRCEQSAAAGGSTRVRVLAPVPYGAAFFQLLGQYHGVVVPSLSDEQPRIVFDAYSQAVPVLASDSSGLKPYVFPGRTGWLIARGDSRALAEGIAEAIASPATMERLGLLALGYAVTITHGRMHLERWRLLVEHLGG